MRSRLLILLMPMLAAFGPFKCESEELTYKSNTFKTRDLSRDPSEVRLPQTLWEKIEDLGRAPSTNGKGGHGGGGGGSGGGGHGEAAPAAEHGGSHERKPDVVTAFSPLKIFLVEKNPGILKDGHTAIEFGPGGGEIDFRDFVEPHNGSFYFVAEFLPDVKDIKRHVYFLSRAKVRTIDGQTYGAGCQTYLDISTAFEKAAARTGFLVNTTEGRHIAALAGTYFFAASHEGKLHLAALTIKDDGQKELQCPPVSEVPHETSDGHGVDAHGAKTHEPEAHHENEHGH